MASTGTYEPETHWADRALRSGGDPLRAACLDDPIENACIDRVQRRVLTAAFDRLKTLIPLRGSRLLDYGCGPGRWVPFFQRWDCQYSGVDLVEPMVTLARTRWPGADIRRLEGERIPYDAGTFDVVVSIAVLHHNGYPTQECILAELRRVLKPGGYLLLFEGRGATCAAGGRRIPPPTPGVDRTAPRSRAALPVAPRGTIHHPRGRSREALAGHAPGLTQQLVLATARF